MRTHSQFLIAAFIWDTLNRRHPPIQTGRAFLVGSILPDVPLMLLTLWYLIHRLQSDSPPSEQNPFYGPDYDEYYFHNDCWKVMTSLFHAPFLIVFYLACGMGVWILHEKWGEALMWFSISCALHSFIDLCTRVEDGILIFFPFNWHERYDVTFSS